ncbi:MAG TPA: hypothetical protein VFV56_13455 [Gaiellaceae bacterium]|jgi:hypothetical protein|nr:hypothetical protein [Gaiellaceae bacterium]
MTDPSALDLAIDRLDAALRAAGLGPLEPATDTGVVAEIAAAVSPYLLPADLARFWERVRVEQDAFPVSGWNMGSLSPPAVALEAYRLNLEPELPMVFGPPLLFPIARHSETQWSVELQSEWTAGGVVVSHSGDMQVEYPSLTDLVEVYAELVEEGAHSAGAQPALLRSRGEAKQRARLADPSLRATYGASLRIGADPSGWPAHWLASAGIDPASRTPLGATYTVAELVATAGAGPVAGRIRGEIVQLGGGGAGYLIVIEDGTGRLDVWCPVRTSPWGPAHRQRVELEVTVRPLAPGDRDGEAGNIGAAAVASDLRPVE